MGRKVAEAVMPELNKELERFNVRLIATYPFPAQVFFCREPITSLADVKGRRVRTPGGSQNDFIQSIGGQPVAIGFPEVYHGARARRRSIAPSPGRRPATARAGTR
jgi:TRAP-type C4-dicarboxylate transport system substrate-binding protein